MKNNNCIICGKPSGKYIFCKDHVKMLDDGRIIKCKNCGKWYIVEKGCDCQIKNTEHNKNNGSVKTADIVAFTYIDEQPKIKRWFLQQNGDVMLRGDNANDQSLIISQEQIANGELKILGVAVECRIKL